MDIRRVLLGAAAALSLTATAAATASAQTFYVNERGGTSTCLKPGIDACPKIKEAVEQAEGTAPPNTIEVETESPGEPATYEENLELTSLRDKELTITGEEAGVTIKGRVNVKSPAGGIVLSNLALEKVGAPAVSATGGAVTLINDRVLSELTARAVEANGGPLTIEGGKVTTESDNGFAVFDSGGALTVANAQIFNGEGGIGSEAGGIDSGGGSLSVSGTRVVNEGSAKTTQFGIVAEGDSAATLVNTTVTQGSPAIGVIFEGSHAHVEGLNVEMADEGVTEAILSEGPAAASFSHVETSGKWSGPALEIFGGSATVSDSRIESNIFIPMKQFALRYGGETTSTLTLQRTIVEAPIKAPAALQVFGGNAALDSSEVLGGQSGVAFEAASTSQELTVAASTVAPINGLSIEAPGPTGVEAKASGKASSAKVAIEGSIVLEPQVATAAAGDSAAISCSYSAVPSQIQTPDPITHAGEVSCAAAGNGNTNASAEALFAEPLHNYTLLPGSSAVDSVPAAALSLPSGIVPSATDLAGAPRVADGNGDCAAVQDKGALELQGHSAPCPSTPVRPPVSIAPTPHPLAGVISALTISPASFHAARKGATISKSKVRYGAKVSWRDSQAATTTFTVLHAVAGRRQGRSCKKPSHANRHGRRCTLLVKVGAFTHVDLAGAESLHFSGRLNGRKLAPGSYSLRAVAHDAAGDGTAASRGFKVL